MLETVLKSITRYSMTTPRNRVAVAVSGGPDSVCLLHVLHELSSKLGVTLQVAHLNHKLRAEESDQDEGFVAGLAANLGLPFYRAETAVGDQPGNLEQNARRARRSFFSDLMRNGIADTIALGHTRDDQAETVLFRILRGSGPAGLAGVLPVTADGIIRPLIAQTRGEVMEYLRSRNIPWREDSSNSEARFARNRIRRALLPQLKRDWNPQLAESLAHLADLAYEDECSWAATVQQLAAKHLHLRDSGIEVSTTALTQLPRAAARYEHIERVLELAAASEGDGQLRLPGLTVARSFEWIRMAPPSAARSLPPVVLSVPGELALPCGGRLKTCWMGTQDTAVPCDNLRAAEVEAEMIVEKHDASIILRGWDPGDHYQPVGHSGDRKIKDLFQQARIPSWRRPLWPIVSVADRIIWARQFGPGAEFVAEGQTGRRLRLKFVAAESGM
jgi:tRNA(Ile)-lysidine synthase